MGNEPTIRGGNGWWPWLWLAAGALACFAEPAGAFPYIDTTGQGTTSGSSRLSAPDSQDLTHQLQLSNGLAAPGAGRGGWTIQPRVTVQEALTDNVLQVHSPMRWDLTTVLSPGISITGATQRLQVRLDYAPVLIVNARTGSQNALNQQLNATASVTVIPEFAFIDLRAVSGIQSLRGAAGAGGTIGAGDGGSLTAGTRTGIGNAGVAGSSQQSTVQTASIGISPYLVQRFGDYGTARLGYSLNMSQISPATGFQYIPFPTGTASQRLVTNEQTAQFRSGSFLNDFQDTIDIDFSQSTSSGRNTAIGSFLGNSSVASNRQIFNNTLSYAVNRALTVTVSVGHENINYTGSTLAPINDVTWSVGGTYTPNPNSSITISYGHQLGTEALSFNGHLQLTPRTSISASYSDTLGTQLENLQNQLNQGVVGANGGFVNGQTGGQLFGSTNNAPVQPGIYHFKSLTATATTQLNRDTVSLTLNASTQTSAGGTAAFQGVSSKTNGVVIQWTRDLRPDMRLSTAASYNVNTGGFTGNGQSIAFNTSLIYTLTDSVSASARYSFFKNTSQNAQFSLFEDIFVVGITKQF